MPSWLPGTEYVLNEIHFHWGLSADELGSEHKIDGVARQAEVCSDQQKYLNELN